MPNRAEILKQQLMQSLGLLGRALLPESRLAEVLKAEDMFTTAEGIDSRTVKLTAKSGRSYLRGGKLIRSKLIKKCKQSIRIDTLGFRNEYHK